MAESVETQEQAVQLYTAARIAIEPDTAAEQTFLQALATELGIEPALAQHIDAQARQMAAA